jgi:hypothetical protein
MKFLFDQRHSLHPIRRARREYNRFLPLAELILGPTLMATALSNVDVKINILIGGKT